MKRTSPPKKTPPLKSPNVGEVEGTFPADREYFERQGTVIQAPDFPLAQIDHQGFGMEVCIVADLQGILFDSLEELELNQVISKDDPRRSDWRPILGKDSKSELAWELIRRAIEGEIIPFGRGMFARGVLWAADKTSAEVQAAAAMIRSQQAAQKGLNRGRRKGAAATREKAKPNRKAIQEQFRRLRREGYAKELARHRISQDNIDPKTGEPKHGFSVRNIQRYT